MDKGLLIIIISWAGVAIWVGLVILNQKKYHPRALFILFFTEMWERFSFYGMRALLVLYMTKLLFSHMAQGDADIRSYGIYGAYTALLWASPVIGGYVADRYTGFRNAILMGGSLMAAGQFTLAATIGKEFFFFVGLALIAVGNGFFKPNISSFLGAFYEQNDPRKDNAFTIFYMGINVGAFLAPVTCGYLGQHIHWSLGFLAAGAGMVSGLVVFILNSPRLLHNNNAPTSFARAAGEHTGKFNYGLLAILVIILLTVFTWLMNAEKITSLILTLAGALCLGFLLYTAYTSKDRVSARRLTAFVFLFFFHMIFWVLYEQAGGSLNILTDRYVNRHGLEASQFQAIPPLFIVLLAPLFTYIWAALRKLKSEPYTVYKFFWALVLMAAGYLVIISGVKNAEASQRLIPLAFIVGMYFFHTVGELSISPVGLSVVTKLSPGKIIGFVMGSWFLSIALGEKIAGYLGQLIAIPGNEPDRISALRSFTHVYLTWGILVMLGSALVLLILSPLLRKWMEGIH